VRSGAPIFAMTFWQLAAVAQTAYAIGIQDDAAIEAAPMNRDFIASRWKQTEKNTRASSRDRAALIRTTCMRDAPLRSTQRISAVNKRAV